MKRAYKMKHVFLTVLIFICLFIFNLGCGLDVLYVLQSPSQSGSAPDQYSSFENRVFEFRTNETDVIEGLLVLGTDVYYKIFDSLDRLNSDVSYINNTDSNSTGKDKLITSGRKFQPLRVAGYSNSVLIPYDGTNKFVSIRLTDYQSQDAYSARILVNGNNLYDSSVKAVPVRNNPERSSFNFGRPNIQKPSNGFDASISSYSKNGIYYVALYAVCVAHDATYTNYFSEPVYLGYVKIDSNSYDN